MRCLINFCFTFIMMLAFLSSQGQYHDLRTTQDQTFFGALEHKEGEVLLLGVDKKNGNVDNGIVVYHFDSNSGNFVLVTPSIFEQFDGGSGFTQKGDSLIAIGYGFDILENKPFIKILYFDLELNLISEIPILLNSNGQIITLSFELKGSGILINYTENEGQGFGNNYFIMSDFEGNIDYYANNLGGNYSALVKILSNSESDPDAYFTSGDYFYSDNVYKINEFGVISEVFEFPFKDSAEIGSPGYTYYQSIGSELRDNKMRIGQTLKEFDAFGVFDNRMIIVELNSQLDDTISVFRTSADWENIRAGGTDFGPNGEMFIAGEEVLAYSTIPVPFVTNNIVVVKLDPSGSEEWEINYWDGNYLVVGGLLATQKGCIVYGNVVYPDTVGGRNPFILMIDSLGNTSDIHTLTSSDHNVSPNPSNGGVFKLSLDQNAPVGSMVKVVDLAGRIVFSEKTEGFFIQIDLSKQAPGAYFLFVEEAQKGRVYWEKIVVQ